MFQIHIGRVTRKPFFILSTSNHFIMLWTGCFMYVGVVRKDPLMQLSASIAVVTNQFVTDQILRAKQHGNEFYQIIDPFCCQISLVGQNCQLIKGFLVNFAFTRLLNLKKKDWSEGLNTFS